MSDLEPGDFFGEMTLIEMQNRSATVVAESATVLYELTARCLYTYYKADIHAYVIVMQNINRELCRRLRRADRRIAELTFTRVNDADKVSIARGYFGVLAGLAGRATPHGSYFSLGSGMRWSAAL